MTMGWREETLRRLELEPDVSVLILGGGINGLGLFRELALQGVDCLVVDRADFAAGASSKSSRMIHGGLRYLENREIRLVRESLKERNLLLENAPHLVSPLRTTMPLRSYLGGIIASPLVFLGLPVKPGGRGALIVKLGLWFYDFVTRRHRKTPKHYFTSREEALRSIPGLDPAIVTAATYWDASISQAERLCIELLDDARAANSRCSALNYASVEEVAGDAVRLRDQPTGAVVTVRPAVVVNATGAWVDATNAALGLTTRFMGGTKGSHLVLDNRELAASLGDRMIYYEHGDGRICIIVPFMGKVIMGSTDIRIDDPDAARCEEDEIDYILSSARGVFPGIPVSRDQIVFTFCGVRPLPAASDRATGTISRDHRIETIEPDARRAFPVLSLVGGKLTTFRALAEEAADRILARLRVRRVTSTENTPIGGGRDFPRDAAARDAWITRVAAASKLSRERIAALLARYGTRAERHALGLEGQGETPLTTLPGYTAEEIRRIATEEYVEHLTDIVARRSVIALAGDATQPALEELAEIAGGERGWNAARRAEEVARALREL
jgi:glycerol-3-phosphate dehydrogenase